MSVSAAMLIVVAAGIFGLLVTSRTAAYQGLHHYLLGLAGKYTRIALRQ